MKTFFSLLFCCSALTAQAQTNFNCISWTEPTNFQYQVNYWIDLVVSNTFPLTNTVVPGIDPTIWNSVSPGRVGFIYWEPCESAAVISEDFFSYTSRSPGYAFGICQSRPRSLWDVVPYHVEIRGRFWDGASIHDMTSEGSVTEEKILIVNADDNMQTWMVSEPNPSTNNCWAYTWSPPGPVVPIPDGPAPKKKKNPLERNSPVGTGIPMNTPPAFVHHDSIGGFQSVPATFDMHVTGEIYSNATYVVKAKNSWTAQWSVVSNLTGDVGPITIPITSSNVQFWQLSTTIWRTNQATGEAGKPLCLYQRTIAPGKWACVANQLDTMDTTIATLLIGAPAGVKVAGYENGSWVTNTWDGSTFGAEQDWKFFSRGTAALVYNPTATNLTLTFAGQVPFIYLTNQIASGYSTTCYLQPRAGTLNELGFRSSIGDIVHKFVPASNTWSNYTFIATTNTVVATNVNFTWDFQTVTNVTTNVTVSTSWSPSVPSFEVGEGFAVTKAATGDWSLFEHPSVWIEPRFFNGTITNYLFDDVVPQSAFANPQSSDTWMMVHADPGWWKLETRTNLGGGTWQTNLEDILIFEGRRAVIRVPTTNAMQFFRLRDEQASLGSGTQSVMIAWDPSASDVDGYVVYYGGESRDYTNRTDVGPVLDHIVGPLNSGSTYYFAVTAYDATRVESDFSNEVIYSVPSLAAK